MRASFVGWCSGQCARSKCGELKFYFPPISRRIKITKKNNALTALHNTLISEGVRPEMPLKVACSRNRYQVQSSLNLHKLSKSAQYTKWCAEATDLRISVLARYLAIGTSISTDVVLTPQTPSYSICPSLL